MGQVESKSVQACTDRDVKIRWHRLWCLFSYLSLVYLGGVAAIHVQVGSDIAWDQAGILRP